MNTEPEPVEVDDTSIYNVYIANRASALLAVAVRLGLFALLDGGSIGEEEIGRRLDLRPRPVAAMLTALRSLGLVRLDEGRWSNAPVASASLVPGKPGWFGGLVELDFDHFVTPAGLLQAMRRDRPVVYGDAGTFDVHERDAERAERFTSAMHSICARPAEAFARAFDFSRHERLLDVGGGSGVMSIAAVRRHQRLRATVLELPAVCPLTRRYVTEAGVSDRVAAVAGDFLADPLLAGHDLVLFSQILHEFPPETALRLARKAFDALPSGGAVLVHEKLVEDDRTGPVANALASLDMLFWTEGQQWTARDLDALLREAGFFRARVEPTVGYWSLVTAVRP